jgi:hypothetical protein
VLVLTSFVGFYQAAAVFLPVSYGKHLLVTRFEADSDEVVDIIASQLELPYKADVSL